jgi:uncharacterized membrane protein
MRAASLAFRGRREIAMHYFPLEPLFFEFAAAMIVILGALAWLGALRHVYARLGLSPSAALVVLVATLLGSYVNIPIYRFPEQHIVAGVSVRFFGMRYLAPTVIDWPGTIVAINFGGAVIPIVLSIYVVARQGVWTRALIATACVAAVCYHLATPVRGVGIAIPVLAPPLAAAAIALLLSWRDAAPIAYACGSLGALIGADLLNLDKVHGLEAPMASIGGAGAFDGVFLTGVIALLLAGLVGGTPRAATA